MGTYCTLATLFITNGTKGRYLTLSHRWNLHGQFQTLKKNVVDLQEGIPNTLSATLNNAILMTALLGFEYLWVDTLCIIQDDFEDKIREIEKMGDIFENATCMLAAVDTVQSDGNDFGLFDRKIPGPPPVHMSCGVWDKSLNPDERGIPCTMSQTVPVGNPHHFIDTIGLKIAHPQGWYIVRNSEWHKRGWVMQERMLSRRTIYFTKYKTFWDCRESSGQEDLQGTIPWSPHRNMPENFHEDTRIQPSLKIRECPGRHWSWLVEEYSKCLLTNEEDKEVAMEGIRQRFERRMNAKINHGILLSTSGCFRFDGLLWVAQRSLKKYQRYTAPSWSWMSIDGPVTYSGFPALTTSIRKDLPSCLSLEGTSLQLKTVLRPVVLGELVRHLGLSNYDDYIPVVGSAIYGEGYQIRRDGIPRPMDQEIPSPKLPPQTRTLKTCRNGGIIGWAVLDREHLKLGDIMCAAIQYNKLVFEEKDQSASSGTVGLPLIRGHGAEEEHVDVILLECAPSRAYNAQRNTFRRLGRGTIVMRGWLHEQRLEGPQDITIL